MPATIPTVEPTCLQAGDSWAWTTSFSDYPASDGWELSYALRGPTDLDIGWGSEVSADDDGFAVAVPASSTGALTPGRYALHGFVAKGSDRYTVYSETLILLPDPADAVNAATTAETQLDAVNALISARLAGSSAGVIEMEIQGDRRRFHTLSELYELRAKLHEEIAQDRRGSGNPLTFAKATFRAW